MNRSEKLPIAVVTLSDAGARVAERLAAALHGVDVFAHEKVQSRTKARRFGKLAELAAEIFGRYGALIYIAPCGAVVRSLQGLLRDKHTDPAVVVVDVGGRYAVSLAGGHEGGANALAVQVANVLGAEPVVTTTTEALKTVIVGVGCRRKVSAEDVVAAVRAALKDAGVALEEVRMLATAEPKAHEAGLLEAAKELGLPLRVISAQEILSTQKAFDASEFVRKTVGLPAVAEPAALLAGRRTRLVLPRTVYGRVTVALARESCLWSE